VLFYAGLGLTLLYSLRLVFVLASPDCHFQVFSSSGSLPLAVAFPFFWLFLLSIVQGSTLFAGQFTSTVVLIASDKLVVWFVIFSATVIAAMAGAGKLVFVSPAYDLGVSTLFFSSITPTCSLLFHTEVCAFQGGGLSLLPALAQRWGLCSSLLAKALFFLCLLAFLV